MRIAIFDVPAEEGGALTILKEYYDKATKDTENQWYFIVSTPDFLETKNITLLKYPWVKRSWFQRLFFDIFIAHRIVKKYQMDEVISLQNVIIPKVTIKQTLYLHQPLPFIEKRYKITENVKFWIYQNIISKMIYKSIKKADHVIVQTKWMRNACINKVDVDVSKFTIQQPDIHINIDKTFVNTGNYATFFYPASPLVYKNHFIIIKALRLLKQKNITNYSVVFTLRGDESKDVIKMFNIVKSEMLPVVFIGKLSLEEVYDYYCRSILIFPSYIETFGLPLLEAKMHKTPIIASDCAFSHEILDDYDNVHFFNPFDEQDLYEKMNRY